MMMIHFYILSCFNKLSSYFNWCRSNNIHDKNDKPIPPTISLDDYIKKDYIVCVPISRTHTVIEIVENDFEII